MSSVGVGDSPFGVVVSSDGATVYVANSGSGTVSVIDAGSGAVIATVADVPGAFQLAISPDGKTLYVTDNSSAVLVVDIDPTNARRVDQDFVTLGWGRDVSDVTPLRGVILGGGEQELEARVTVSPLSA